MTAKASHYRIEVTFEYTTTRTEIYRITANSAEAAKAEARAEAYSNQSSILDDVEILDVRVLP